MIHLNKHDILVDYQHGFRKNHSCETQLINTMKHLARSIDNRCEKDLLILDFSKAFDKAAHNRLPLKMNYYGIHGPILTWMRSWLIERTQQAVLEGSCSERCHQLKLPRWLLLPPHKYSGLLVLSLLACVEAVLWSASVCSGWYLWLPHFLRVACCGCLRVLRLQNLAVPRELKLPCLHTLNVGGRHVFAMLLTFIGNNGVRDWSCDPEYYPRKPFWTRSKVSEVNGITFLELALRSMYITSLLHAFSFLVHLTL